MNSLIIQRDFDPEIAKELDTDAAIILENIVFWIGQNKVRGKNLYEGKYWTYNTTKALQTFFPYLTEKQIRTRLLKLEELKYITTGNFNKIKYDKTTWYALGEKYEHRLTHLPSGNIEVTKWANGNDQTGTPIPDDKPNYKPNIYNFDTIEQNTTNTQESTKSDDKNSLHTLRPSIKKANKGKSGFVNTKNFTNNKPYKKFEIKRRTAAHGETII